MSKGDSKTQIAHTWIFMKKEGIFFLFLSFVQKRFGRVCFVSTYTFSILKLEFLARSLAYAELEYFTLKNVRASNILYIPIQKSMCNRIFFSPLRLILSLFLSHYQSARIQLSFWLLRLMRSHIFTVNTAHLLLFVIIFARFFFLNWIFIFIVLIDILSVCIKPVWVCLFSNYFCLTQLRQKC